MTYTVTPGNATPRASLIGGKAAGLWKLTRIGQPVPPFYVITTAAHAAGLTPAVAQAIRETHARVIPGGAFVAVRSSAVGEDAADASFAGLHESYLFVTEENLLDAVEKVWASAHSERAMAYRQEKNLPTDGITIAVVVQQMIDAKASGVVFTANPTTNDVHEVVISSLFGIGEGLVSAGFDADTFVVQKSDLSISMQLAEKGEAIVFDHERGSGTKAVEVEDPLARSLGDHGVRELARAAMAIERAFGRPQDIEFAWNDHRLYILQSRPITTLQEHGPAAGHRLLWDNSNIVESFSGVTSPLTFSVIRRAYAIVYRCFAEVMGIPQKTIRANQAVFENMLGLFRGQVYYNLLNWYALVRLFPGFEYNRAYMESMMGVREAAQFTEAPARASFAQRYFVELPALLKLVGRSAGNFIRIKKLVREFETNFREHYTRWSAIDVKSLRPDELMNLYREFEDRVLWTWRPPIINDFFVMIFYGTLKKLCAKWCGDESGSLQNDLLTGEGGIESAEPAKMLLRLASSAKKDAALVEAIRGDDALTRIRDFPAFAAEIDRYLDLYGFRCMNELKLEEHSLRDRPEILVTYVRNYLDASDETLDVHRQEERERALRLEAEKRAFAKLKFWQRPLFRFVLRCARLGVKNRENMRFARTRIFGLVREVVRAMGHRLHEEGLLDAPDDVFMLGLDELWDYVKGTALTTDLRGLVAVRQAEFAAYRANPVIDERFETFGMAYNRNAFRSRSVEAAPSEDGTLRGIACSPGTITGVVKVLRSPQDDMRLAGEILVAERTDPGWVPLYPSISGLLIERGSILSHSAIVAREMGIPTIVGIRGLTSLVKTGDTVTMDGSTGVLQVHPGNAGER
ncbi:MAG TPA: PEP/pyruvate-binding domain-containing protein [Thermoanaerobaculia bacterium]